jgi:CrcB protein
MHFSPSNHISHNYSAVVNLIREIVVVAAGGICGASLRVLVQELPIMGFQSLLLVNLAGSFVLGVLLHVIHSKVGRLFFGTGILGGFTTTSAFAVTTLTDFSAFTACVYVLITFYGGLLLFRLASRLMAHA